MFVKKFFYFFAAILISFTFVGCGWFGDGNNNKGDDDSIDNDELQIDNDEEYSETVDLEEQEDNTENIDEFVDELDSEIVDLEEQEDIIENIDQEEIQTPRKEKTTYVERDLHPLLSYFAYSNGQFNRGKAILTKTIFHEKSRKDGLSEWVHPDIVGVYIPIEDWNREIIELNNISNSNAITLLSFELKKSIDRNNYREYFFQAVSNSSWANEGYLVAANIAEDDELLNELERLSTSFGIGLI